MLAAFQTTWRRTRRRWRQWRAKVRRERVVLALLALLTFGMGEPLLCIIHCDLWLPSTFQPYLAGHHHHHNHGQSATAHAAQANPAPTGAAVQATTSDGTVAPCFHNGSGEGVPFHVPPSPVHEMLPALLVLIVILLAPIASVRATPRDPPRVYLRPLLRPPIPFAA